MDNETLLRILKNLQLERYTLPHSVPVTKNIKEETQDQIEKIQDKFLTLSDKDKDKLVSPKTAEIIKEIGRNYNLEIFQLADISRAIRSYYFGELKLDDFPVILSMEMRIDSQKAQDISNTIINKIIEDNTWEEKYKAKIKKLTLVDALKQYPKVGEQLISLSPLRLKNFPAPARPSIGNWINDYRLAIGVQRHGAVERGNYLFQSENAKKLTAADRQKVAYILKSLDEGSALEIDEEKMEVAFPTVELRSTAKMSSRPALVIPDGHIPPVTLRADLAKSTALEATPVAPKPQVKIDTIQNKIFNPPIARQPIEENKMKPPEKVEVKPDNEFLSFVSTRPRPKNPIPFVAPKPISRPVEAPRQIKIVPIQQPQNKIPTPAAPPISPVESVPPPVSVKQEENNVNKVAFSAPQKFMPQRRMMFNRISPIGTAHYDDIDQGSAVNNGPKISGNLVDLRS